MQTDPAFVISYDYTRLVGGVGCGKKANFFTYYNSVTAQQQARSKWNISHLLYYGVCRKLNVTFL